MPKRSSDINKECQICGSLIWGKGQKVLLEGARITVCQVCAQYGTKIHERPRVKVQKHPQVNKFKTPQKKSFNKRDGFLEPSLEIVEDYGKRVRNARYANNLTQEQFAKKIHEKESLIRRIEAEKVKPTIKIAKKIEKAYNISLLKETDDIEIDTRKYLKKSKGSSLGDFIK